MYRNCLTCDYFSQYLTKQHHLKAYWELLWEPGEGQDLTNEHVHYLICTQECTQTLPNLPTFGNQKSEYFIIARSRLIIHCTLHCTLKSMSNLHGCFGLIKVNSSQFTEKWPGKILIYVLNITSNTRIFTGWNSRKSRCPDFLRFWKSNIWTVW